jgi:hypothetical protein
MLAAKANIGGKKERDRESWTGYAIGMMSSDRGAEKAIGRASTGMSFSTEFEVSGWGISVGYEAKYLTDNGEIDAIQSRDISVQLKIPGDLIEKIEPYIEKVQPVIDTIMHIVETKEAVAKEKTKKGKAAVWMDKNLDKAKEVAAEQVEDAIMNLGPVKAVTDVGDEMKKAIVDAAKSSGIYEDEESTAVGLSIDLRELGVEVSIIKSEEKKLNLSVIEASMKKTSKKSLGFGSKK